MKDQQLEMAPKINHVCWEHVKCELEWPSFDWRANCIQPTTERWVSPTDIHRTMVRITTSVNIQESSALCSSVLWVPQTHRGCCVHLVGQIHHTQVRLYFEAEGWEAGHAILWPGELVKDDGVFRVQLLLLPTHREQVENTNIFRL